MRIVLFSKLYSNRCIRIKAERRDAVMAIQKHEYDNEASENDTTLAIKISSALCRRIKKAANSSNLSVDEYVEHVLEQAIQRKEETAQTPKKLLTQEQLAQVLHVSEQIQHNTQGHIFEDPVEVIRKMREERQQELEGW
jgi:predicted DNA binding CopG/RHH family protein